MLVTSTFFFSHNVFYNMRENMMTYNGRMDDKDHKPPFAGELLQYIQEIIFFLSVVYSSINHSCEL